MYSGEKSIDTILQQGYEVKIGDYLQRGWQIMQQNLGGFIGFAAIIALVSVIPQFMPERLVPLASIAVNIITPVLAAGALIVAFKIIKQQTTTFGDFFQGFNKFLPIFLTNLVVGIFVFLGLLLLIIPGIYLGVAYSFAVAFVVGRNFDFWEAMETSRKVITRRWFSFFAFLIVLLLINIAGALLLGIGLLFTGPLTTCAIAAAFDDIVGLSGSSVGDSGSISDSIDPT
jgi:uncharacterized membrane protein